MKRILISVALAGLLGGIQSKAAIQLEGGTANTGARLFLETRFSRHFYIASGGNPNFVLTNGDPVMDLSDSIYGPLPGPFAGRAMNCRACHLVAEQINTGNRTYADFARRSPIPDNGDGRTRTPRNSLDLVNSLIPRSTPLFLHNDGEFVDARDLVISTFTGRNFGWHPSEYQTALAHLVKIIREDDGTGSLAQQYGGYSYAQAFAGGLEIADPYRIANAFVLSDVTVTNPAATNYVTDEQIIQNVAGLVQAYLGTLVFSQDNNDLFDGSAYDVFLIKNGLPRAPGTNETDLAYARRLRSQVENLPNPQYVADPADGHLGTHNLRFQFGPTELDGLKTFLAENDSPRSVGTPGKIGNCIACHAPPAFTDFLFHNTGATQEEYDSIHGAGTFMALNIPGLPERETNYDACLPPTPTHPNALGTFITPPTTNAPGQVDLGLWNVFANPDFPKPQPALRQIVPLLLPVAAPKIESAVKVGNEFIFSGTNGTPGWAYHVLSSTNLALPMTNWAIVSTNVFDGAGRFAVTNSLARAGEFFTVSAAIPSDEQVLPRTIGLFKTPDLRDLASSEPYLHTGRFDTLPEVIAFYRNFSQLARAGLVRNPSPQIKTISLDDSAVAPLVAFLRSLSEDYEDVPCPCQR